MRHHRRRGLASNPLSRSIAWHRGLGARGLFTTPHGVVETPAFMAVGTLATVKALDPDDLRAAGAQMILANAYHLHLRPGDELVRQMGGLHRFMGWDGPILTDSGGFQVFSLGRCGAVDEDGVEFQSHLDGSRRRFTPESVMEIERNLGADVVMQFDHVIPGAERRSGGRATPASAACAGWRAAAGVQRAGARRPQALFPIVQGGIHADLRREAARAICDLDDWNGYRHRRAVGRGGEAATCTRCSRKWTPRCRATGRAT